MLSFPDGFVWGVATSSYQIEGAVSADGRGESIWDRFARRPGNILDGANGDRACEHYMRMPQDVALMQSLALKSYRFSIAWPRVLPQGTGTVNAAGLGFYDRLVDELLAAGISPLATLYHWDLPQALQDRGGWANRDVIHWFSDYARAVFDKLGDRVQRWATLNEPWCSAFLGHATGEHAPGKCNYAEAYQTAHHLLLAHGQTVQQFRQGGYGGQIGIVLNLDHFVAASDSAADQAARQRAVDENTNLFMEPLYHGRYPQALLDWIGPHQPVVQAGDLDLIRQPLDFLGINYYKTHRVEYAVNGGLLKLRAGPVSAPGAGLTEMGWGINPGGLTALLVDISKNFGSPNLYVTENGCALVDTPDAQGFVADWGRVNYLRDHLHAAHEAIRAGANLRGYYAWSLLDNFEWAWGYGPRFGIVRVDFETQQRIPKQSALWYREAALANGFAE